MTGLLERLRGGLIVSVQAREGSVLNAPETIATLAACAEANGAAGVRIEGIARIAAVRDRVRIPIVGILKRPAGGDVPYITASRADVQAVLAAGADIVAFDATRRARPDGSSTEELVALISAAGAVAMADCAQAEDARAAARAGAQIVATTLCGYTDDTAGTALPAIGLVPAFRATGAFAIVEGGVRTPHDAAAAFAEGADAVVVGTAITDIDALVASFVQVSRTRG